LQLVIYQDVEKYDIKVDPEREDAINNPFTCNQLDKFAIQFNNQQMKVIFIELSILNICQVTNNSSHFI
jgi:hypothetical protein